MLNRAEIENLDDDKENLGLIEFDVQCTREIYGFLTESLNSP